VPFHDKQMPPRQSKHGVLASSAFFHSMATTVSVLFTCVLCRVCWTGQTCRARRATIAIVTPLLQHRDLECDVEDPVPNAEGNRRR